MANVAYFDECKTFRMRAGLPLSALAREAEVDRATLSKVEKHHAARYETLMRIVNALNTLHYATNGAPLDGSVVITPSSRFGGGLQR